MVIVMVKGGGSPGRRPRTFWYSQGRCVHTRRRATFPRRDANSGLLRGEEAGGEERSVHIERPGFGSLAGLVTLSVELVEKLLVDLGYHLYIQEDGIQPIQRRSQSWPGGKQEVLRGREERGVDRSRV